MTGVRKMRGIAIVAAVAAAAGILAILFVPASDGPPLTGWTAKIEILGDPVAAPDATFTGPEGNEVSLADFEGRVVLLNFWATWCAPCVREMPALDRLQAARGGDDFQVVAVSIDRNGLEDVEPFFERHELEVLPIYLDTGSHLAREFGVRTMPTTAIIDPDGRIVAIYEGDAEWDEPEAVALIDWYAGREQ